jgi:hypothetical protein
MVTSIWRKTCSLASLIAEPKAPMVSGVLKSKTGMKSSWVKYVEGSSPHRLISIYAVLTVPA